MSSVGSGGSQLSKVADLHVFVVPVELWLDKYRTAFNNIALESVSAGFVRVSPDVTLNNLRGSIEEQLGEDIIPDDFIYLRSVGRCMAVVKENQEYLLRVTDFLPPVAYSPEIFLLPGLHETYARPASDASNVVIATHGHSTAGLATTQPLHLPSINPHQTNQQLVTQPPYGAAEPHGYHQRQDSEDSTTMRHHQKAENPYSKRSSLEGDRPNVHFDEEQEEQMDGYHGDSEHRSSGDTQELGLSPRDIEYVRSKNRKSKSKKGSSGSSGSDFTEEVKTVKIIQPEIVHNLPVAAPGGVYISPPTPIPSGRVISSPLPGHRREQSQTPRHQTEKEPSTEHHSKKGLDSASKHGQESVREGRTKKGGKKKKRTRSRSPSIERRHQLEQDNVTLDMGMVPEDEYVIPTIEDVNDRSKYSQFPSPAKSTRSRHNYESEMDSGIADDFATPPQGLDDSLNGRGRGRGKNDSLMDKSALDGRNGDGSGLQGNHDDGQGNHDDGQGKLHGEGDTLHGADRDILHGDALGSKHGKGDGVGDHENDKSKGKDSKTIKKTKRAAPKKTVKKADDLDQSFKIPKVPVPPPLQMPDMGDMPLAKDTASAKDRKQKIVEELRGELRRAKNERVDMEKQREQKVRRAKTLQTQTLQKRNQLKNIWKKKFFDEKRKTAPLEEQVNRLRYDMEIQHKAMISFLESKKDRDGNNRGGQELEKNPSQKSNQLMLLARLQNEIEDLRRKVEETKMRLASEMKMRDAAQNELKQLREDLMEKKINLTLTKSQKSLATLGNPENITV